jgi:aminopeptidase N
MKRTRWAALALGAVLALGGCRAAPAGDGVEAPPPQPGVDVTAYQAELRLDPETRRLGARAALDVTHPDTLSALRLGLDEGLEVRAVRVNAQPVQLRREGDVLTVPLRGGSASRVEVVYRGVPAAGLYQGEAAGQTVVYTDSWPDRAAGWLPGVHHPSDPATLDLTLVVPERYEVVASGAPALDSLGGGSRTARFVLDAPAPVYTFAFAVADFTITTDSTAAVPVRTAMLAAEAARAARLRRTPQALDTLAALLGPYPYAAYTAVQVPMVYAGMENAAAPFLRADLFAAEATGRNAIEEVNFHELVHQWWGNQTVPADWRDLWLVEGLTTYLVADLYHRLDGTDTGRRHLALLVRETARDDARRALRPAALADPADALTQAVYNKGAAVFHLIRLRVGDRAFFDTVRARLRDRRPLSTDALRAAFEQASGQPLGPLFAYWVDGRAVPTLQTRWDARAQTLAWDIEGDDATLDGIPFHLLIRQDGVDRFVPATDGAVSLPGTDRPDVLPVGILLDVD